MFSPTSLQVWGTGSGKSVWSQGDEKCSMHCASRLSIDHLIALQDFFDVDTLLGTPTQSRLFGVLPVVGRGNTMTNLHFGDPLPPRLHE